MKPLIIATRQSPLALWQAHFVKESLTKAHPGLQVELKTFVTKGDKILDTPLAKIGGKGLFVKELEQALLAGEADLAVHSCKDMPMELPSGLSLSALLQRHSPFDALVSNQFDSLSQLPQGAVVGTSSLRRKCQLLAHRPDLQIKDLRGNVGTRLSKLDAGEYQAVVLACSGLERLNLGSRITEVLEPELCLPAVAQGALAVETRSQDSYVDKLLAPLVCTATTAAVNAERAMNKKLDGGCQVPIAGFATFVGAGSLPEPGAALNNSVLSLTGRVLNADGSVVIESTQQGSAAEPAALGERVADQLIEKGARALLAEFYS